MGIFTQRNFAAGEIAPVIYSRVDTTKYATGLRACRNMMVMRHGGVTNRPGTEFIGPGKYPSKQTRLIPFIFDADTSYALEFGDGYMRVIQNGVYLKAASQALTAATNANPCVVTYSGADTYANGDTVYISGIVGPIGSYLNNRYFKVAGVNAGANTFQLNTLSGVAINSTTYGAYTSGGTVEEVYTLTSIYLEADLPDVTYAQSADILEMTHPVRGPQRVARLTSSTWDTAYVPFYGIPAPTAMAVSGAAAVGNYTDVLYSVVDVSDVTGEEGTAKQPFPAAYAKPTVGAPHTVTWTSSGLVPAGGVTTYVYRSYLGVYGLLGISKASTFFDDGSVNPLTSLNTTKRQC